MTEEQDTINHKIIEQKGLANAFNSLCNFIDSSVLDQWQMETFWKETFIENQKPMDGDFQKFVNEHFWELIGEIDNHPKNDYDPHANYKGEVHTKQEYIDWRFSLGFGNLYDEDLPLHIQDKYGEIIGVIPVGPEGYIDDMFTCEEWHDFHIKLSQKMDEYLKNVKNGTKIC